MNEEKLRKLRDLADRDMFDLKNKEFVEFLKSSPFHTYLVVKLTRLGRNILVLLMLCAVFAAAAWPPTWPTD